MQKISSVIAFPAVPESLPAIVSSLPAVPESLPAVPVPAEIVARARVADALMGSDRLCTVNELAKLLRGNGVKVGQNTLYARLRSEGYLCTRKSIRNLPTQNSMNRGLFRVSLRPYLGWDSSPRTSRSTMVTPKGVEHFIRKYIPESPAEAPRP